MLLRGIFSFSTYSLNKFSIKYVKKIFQSHATQREHEMLKKKTGQEEENKTKKTKVNLEIEKRHEGLQKSIDSSNKGFAMLAKMGYKAGESLGKSNSGRIEPIPIEVKNDRGGLGKIILTLYILYLKYFKVFKNLCITTATVEYLHT